VLRKNIIASNFREIETFPIFLFDNPVGNVLPADFDNSDLFEEIKDIWLS